MFDSKINSEIPLRFSGYWKKIENNYYVMDYRLRIFNIVKLNTNLASDYFVSVKSGDLTVGSKTIVTCVLYRINEYLTKNQHKRNLAIFVRNTCSLSLINFRISRCCLRCYHKYKTHVNSA